MSNDLYSAYIMPHQQLVSYARHIILYIIPTLYKVWPSSRKYRKLPSYLLSHCFQR